MDIILPSKGDNIIRTKDPEENYDKDGLGSMLFKAMLKHRTKTAQIDSHTGRSDTYEEFLRKAVKVAEAVKSLGIKPGDIICFCSENHCDVYITYVAAHLIGAVTSALDPIMSRSDVQHLLSQVPPKLVFTTPKSEALIGEVLSSINLTPDVVIFGKTDKYLPFDDLLLGLRDYEDFTPHKIDDVFETAVILFSSGTTGLPKGICINHYSLMCNSISAGSEMMDGAQVFLGFATVYWISCVQFFFTSILEGITRILTPRFDADQVWSLIDKYNVNIIIAAANQGARMLNSPIANDVHLSSLKTLLIGGAKVSEDLMKSLKVKLPDVKVRQGYGMTEIGGLCILQRPEDVDFNPASCGRVRQGIWYKVVNPETERILGPNKPGELRLQTKLQMNGYYKIDQAEAWDSDGWLRTGDIVYYDENYLFYFLDRLKGVIKYRGIHVPSTKLEEILQAHPAVGEAAVIGLPHPDDEEHPMAAVVLAKDAGDVSEEELRRYVDDRVDDPKKLRGGVKIVKELPTTPSGKLNKRELKRRICEEMNIAL